MSRLSERLKAAKGDLSIDDIAKRASREGGTIKRSTVAKYLRGEHGSNPPEETLAGLAAGLGLDVRELRELAGRPAGELGPYVPTPLSASLTTEQRKAIDDLIKAFVIEGGQKDAGNAEAEKSPDEAVTPNVTPETQTLAARRGDSRGKRQASFADQLGQESQDDGGWEPA